ncbi:uncharacterized protein LOC132615222 [Lycium barbarum]|uniref:uncharacterized protein LOC132615222 n=1 Tax=Lycium barbarum TaxID=112863 RepID=UPI00293E117E|nr:uncharacterized protein LOC132615222 [Lycium barbarum]
MLEIIQKILQKKAKELWKQCISNVASSLQTFYGREQVIDFFNSIIKILKNNNFEFVIEPTIHDGTNVGVAWELACSDTHIPVGKGFSFYTCHYYQGKMLIRNVEIFMEPLLHIEPVRLVSNSVLKGSFGTHIVAGPGAGHSQNASGFTCEA